MTAHSQSILGDFAELLGTLSPRELAGQVLIVGFEGQTAPASITQLARDRALGGVVLFKRNISGPEQTAELIRELGDSAAPGLGLLVALDQEGGRVARHASPVVKLPPMRALGTIDDSELTRRAGRVLGRQLRALGYTMDFAPVLDVDSNPQNPVIGDRSFGADPDLVARHGLAFAQGLWDSGLLACAKHFPGHGDTELDSHLALPKLAHNAERLQQVELRPFRDAGRMMPAIMTAHVVYEAIDPGVPATLSRKVVDGMLRRELGYQDVIITDDMEMKAIADNFGVGDAACRAIAAGCDALLVCSKWELIQEAHNALTRLAEQNELFHSRLVEAVTRFVAMRSRAVSAPLSGAALRAELELHEARELEAEIARRLER